MGIRSDVFFAHKASITLPQKFVVMLTQRFGAEVLSHSEGTAYHMQDIKWYPDDDAEVGELYNYLENLDCFDDCVIVEACHDYPEYNDGDYGAWNDNPWRAYRFVRTGIEFAQ